MKISDELKNLDDAIQYIKGNVTDGSLVDFARGSEEDTYAYHHTFGMAMRNGFNLWGESELSKWFNSKGILHADDMSGIILTSLHRNLNNVDIKLDQQINSYRTFWRGQGVNPDTMERYEDN